MTFDDPIKQEIWHTLRALNVAWTKGNPDDLTKYFHPDMVAIAGTERLRIVGRDACVASWKQFAQEAVIHHWNETDPLISVYGNAAVVTYYFDMSFDMDGRRIDAAGRDMYVFVREDGRWLAVADQFSLYPQQA